MYKNCYIYIRNIFKIKFLGIRVLDTLSDSLRVNRDRSSNGHSCGPYRGDTRNQLIPG